MIDEKCKECLINASHDTLARELESKKTRSIAGCNNCPKSSTFVTLKEYNELRGCIGNLESNTNLFRSVIKNTLLAAFHDTRFHPLEKEELKDLEIEISILTEPKPLSYSSPMELLSKLKPSRMVLL